MNGCGGAERQLKDLAGMLIIYTLIDGYRTAFSQNTFTACFSLTQIMDVEPTNGGLKQIPQRLSFFHCGHVMEH